MPKTLTIGPLPRIEGHLDIRADVEIRKPPAASPVVSAASDGTMFRGFEIILQGRDPRDAPNYTQRICGVCPTAHGMAASLALEMAAKVVPPDNGRILRNLIQAADFLHSHILHFYQLALMDYIDASAALPLAPWTPQWQSPDLLTGAIANGLKNNYVLALTGRRGSHQMGAIFGGKLPHSPRFGPGGCTEVVSAQNIANFRRVLSQVSWFINNKYLLDVQMLANHPNFRDYYQIGAGPGNLLAYGVFDLNATGSSKLLARGIWTKNGLAGVEPSQIVEYFEHSRYSSSSSGINPGAETTVPQASKTGAYSWIKAPRYGNRVCEVGPLARMWVSGGYRRGISVMDRLVARALEAQKIANAMPAWLDQLVPGKPVQVPVSIPASATAIGLTEAARGALGHWVKISRSLIQSYQIVSPTGWNASPADDAGRGGAIEQALVGTPVRDPAQPIELLRVVHSFDPCLACSVHTVRLRDGEVVR